MTNIERTPSGSHRHQPPQGGHSRGSSLGGPAKAGTTNSQTPQGGYFRWLRPVRRFVLTILVIYLLGVLMLAFLQRSLIYIPSRQFEIEPAESGFPDSQVHTIQVPTSDGLTLNGWHLLPDGNTARDVVECDRRLEDGRPVILFFSGNAGNRTYRDKQFALFTRLDCHVLVFDYRGYGDNAGSPSEANLAADAQTAWQYATQDRKIAPGRIILFGESLGGGVAVRLAAELCNEGTPPGGLALRATFSSLVDTASKHYPWLPVRWLLIDRYPSVDRIPDVTCPILHLHGNADAIVPIALGHKLIDAAPERSASGIPKRFVELPGVGHNDIMYVAEDLVEQAFAEWLEEID